MKKLLLLFYLVMSTCGLKAELFKTGMVITDARAQKLIETIITKLNNASGRLFHPKIYFLVNSSINAFATEDNCIFIHTGLITSLEKVDQLVGVLAHELGHIAGGHHHRFSKEIRGVKAASVIGTLLGGVAAIAGAGPAAFLGVMALGEGAAYGTLARFSQLHEKEADSAAYNMLKSANLSADGLVSTFELFKRKNMFSEPPYLQTHPADQDRINAIKNLKEQKPYPGVVPQGWQEEFEAVQAVFAANLLPIRDVERKYYKKDTPAALLAKIIILSRKGQNKEALKKLDMLVSASPNNPYLQELSGQINLQAQQETSALEHLQKALYLAPDALSIRLLYAQALYTTKVGNVYKALEQLKRITQDDPDNVMAWLLMAGAYRKLGNNPENSAMADLAHAEAALRMGDINLAMQRITRASHSSNPKIKARAQMLLSDDRLQKESS